ncbi:MAG: hypothetical protein U5Q44_08715 [Dehalococcoidia bacterium]|nr:hypothetical protein [Dehalococcoidia bacterium]
MKTAPLVQADLNGDSARVEGRRRRPRYRPIAAMTSDVKVGDRIRTGPNRTCDTIAHEDDEPAPNGGIRAETGRRRRPRYVGARRGTAVDDDNDRILVGDDGDGDHR